MNIRQRAKAAAELVLRFGLRGPVRMRGRALVLAYHNVVPDALASRGDRSLHLSQSAFLSQLDFIQTHCHVVPLTAVLDGATTADLPTVAITFDDAYRGAVEWAVPALVSRGLDSTLFVAPGLLERTSFWWDEFADGLGGVPDALRTKILELDAGQPRAGRTTAASRRPAAPLPECYGCASEAQVRGLSELQCVRIGAHSWSHPNLARISPEALELELRRPLGWLGALKGGAVSILAYPYGLHSGAVRRAARLAGYSAALCVDGGWLPPNLGDRWNVPRYNVPAGISQAGFAIRLSGIGAS